jgi:hypothetical protein
MDFEPNCGPRCTHYKECASCGEVRYICCDLRSVGKMGSFCYACCPSRPHSRIDYSLVRPAAYSDSAVEEGL